MYLFRLTLLWLLYGIALPLLPSSLRAQTNIDSLRQLLEHTDTETKRIDITNSLAFAYTPYSIDKARELASEALEMAKAIAYEKGTADSYSMLGITYSMEGNAERGMEYFLTSLRQREAGKDTVGIAKTLNNLAGVSLYQRNWVKAILYSRQSLEILKRTNDSTAIGNAYLGIGLVYQAQDNHDSSAWYFNRAFHIFNNAGASNKVLEAQLHIAAESQKQKQYQRAYSVIGSVSAAEVRALNPVQRMQYHEVTGRVLMGLQKYPDALFHLQRAWKLAQQHRNTETQNSASQSLTEYFQLTGRPDSALYYLQQHMAIREQAISLERSRQTAILEKLYSNEKQEKALALTELKLKRQSQTLILVAILLFSVFIVAIIQFIHYRRKKRTNSLLLTLNAELVEQQQRISAYAEELTTLNNQMEVLNQSLEEKIRQRTAEITERNRKLIEYAYINAHHTRGPLARILGLVNLFNFHDVTPEVSNLVSMLHASSQELDNVIKEINNKLAEENFSSEITE